MKAFAPRARTVLFTHGIEVWTPLGTIRQWALQQGDLVLAPSADTARHLIEKQGLDRKGVSKLAWSLGPEFDAAASVPAPGGAPDKFPRGRVILTVGRWDLEEAYKGVDHLIMSLSALISEVPDVQLVAIGGGSDLPRLRRLASETGVADR
jgi:glycosyltransferase involved in cell wall biosynthesis